MTRMWDPWNDRSILPPPINTVPSEINFSLKDLNGSCNAIINVLSKQSPLHKESAIFSRFLYKFDKKFRNDIGYRHFKKVYTALRKYLSLHLIKDVQNFIDVLPSNSEMEPYLPTRQMLEYIMVRVMTFSKLMYRITVCCKQTAIFYLDRIRRGESHWMCLMPYALLCRMWSMSQVLLQHSCNWYNQLYPFLKFLPQKGLNFLSSNYKLPVNLEKWIDMTSLSHIGRFDWYQKLNIDVDAIMIEDEDGELGQNILKYVNEINKKSENCEEPLVPLLLPKLDKSIENTLYDSNDKGVAISRESFKQLMGFPDVLSNPSVREKHSIENVTDKNSLTKFIENEDIHRNESNNMALTNHLSFMQWQALKMALLKLDSALINRKKLERKVQNIWQEKCLDYL